MMKASRSLAAVLALLWPCATAWASSFAGGVYEIKVSTGTTPVRMSVLVDDTSFQNDCSGSAFRRYYAYENADTGIRKLWTSAFLLAIASGATVVINGNGACDAAGIEGILAVTVR
jgi:hypothetical protein